MSLDAFAKVYVQLTNAATLRCLMGLTRTGRRKNVENVKLAYTFTVVNFLEQSEPVPVWVTWSAFRKA